MASRRQSLKALAEERGLRVVRVHSPDESHVGFWSVFAERCRNDADVVVHAPTRRAATEGLRAALESMPLKRKGRG